MSCPSCLVAVSGTEGLGESAAVCSTASKLTIVSFGFLAGILAALWIDEMRVRKASEEAGYAYARGWTSGAKTRRPRR